VIWSLEALDDLERMREYIARDSPYYADLFVSSVFEVTDRLAAYPFSGRKIPEFNRESSRETSYGSCRIMYEVEQDLVIIVSLVHAARQWPPELEQT